MLTEITNDAAGAANTSQHIDLAANLYFGIGSTIFVAIVLTLVTAKLVEGRLGDWDPADAGEGIQTADETPDVTPEAEARGLRLALWATLAVLAVVTLLTAIPGAPLRNPVTGKIIGDSPFMDSLILIITLVFFAAGLAYGRGAGTIKTKEEVIATITKSWAGLAGLLFLFLLIAQFIAYFNFSNMAEVAAVKLGDVLEHIEHRRGVAADRLHHRHRDRRPDHPAGDRQVGAAGADLHSALHPAGRRAADRARCLSRRRLAVPT